MSLQRHFSHQQANRENSESFLFLYQCTCLKSFLRIQKCYWIYKSNCKAQSHTYCSACLCLLPEVWTKSLLCNILICAACQKSRNKQKERSIPLYQVSKAGIQNEIVAKGKYAVIKQLNSEKLCCSIKKKLGSKILQKGWFESKRNTILSGCREVPVQCHHSKLIPIFPRGGGSKKDLWLLLCVPPEF